MSLFQAKVDVANRAIQHCGATRVSSLTQSVKQAREANFAIDMIRVSELQQSGVWTFATRRAVMRPIVSTSKFVTFPTYAAGSTYGQHEVVQDSTSYVWRSTKASNLANTPGADNAGNPAPWTAYAGPVIAQAWDNTVPYYIGDVVYVSTTAYICIAAHTGHTPPNATYWAAQTTGPATLSSIVLAEPLGLSNDAATQKGIYRKPANFLRIAVQDMKAAAVARPGFTAGMQFNDWEFEGDYLFTADTAPFVMRFVADQTDIPTMHPLFLESWAARLGMQLSPSLTQNPALTSQIQEEYDAIIAKAKATLAIEAGSDEPDPFVAASVNASRPRQQQGAAQ